ncbi:MAG TPA: MFS transporter [Candidatus Dormibacteraeota bacterium]|nr:MFS transporter [Candidatus Dormibacteraeota bacterium]
MSLRSKDPTFVYLVLQTGGSLFFRVLATTNLVYQVEVAHLDPLRLLLIGTVLELTCFVFQVPTGAFADAISRRWAVALGCGLVGAGFILEGLVPQFTAIALAQVIWGVGATLSDGADDAWITDEVGVDRAGGLFLRASQFAQASALLGILIGVGLATIRLNLPILVGGGFYVLLGVYLFFAMTETGYQAIPRQRRDPITDMVTGIRASVAAVRNSRLIVIILAITVVWGLSGEGIDRLNQVHFLRDVGLPNFAGLSPVLWFGVISGGSTLIGIATTSVIRRRLDLQDHRQVTQLLFVVTAARALMAAGFALATNLVIAITFFWLASAMRQAFGPVQRAWLNRSLDSANRATLLSVDGQADALGQIAGGPMIGAIGSGVSIRAALLASAALLGAALPLLARALTETSHRQVREPRLVETER